MPTSTDPRINQWISFSDFTSGCFSYSPISGHTAVAPAPLGAADARYTKGCIALPNGGLAPLPKFTTSYNYPVATLPFATFTNKIWLTQFMPRSFDSLTDMLFINLQGIKKVGPTITALSRFITFRIKTGGVIHLIETVKGAIPIQTFGIRPYSVINTRMAFNTATSDKPGRPIVVCMHVATGGTVVYRVATFPDLTTPTLFKFKILTTWGSKVSADVIGFQGRVLVLANTEYFMPTATMFNNEAISYTTPANSPALGAQQIVLDPTDPFGYGSWGSISAGELFLVKKRGGAVLLTGDINYPTVTKLPGVQSTGIPGGNTVLGQAIESPAGLFYPSHGNGLWLWNGGNVSQKVSQNLDDTFYEMTTQFRFSGTCWGEWVLVSNSWLYDIRTQGWWKLSQPGIFWYGPSFDLNKFFAIKQFITNTTTVFGYQMDKTKPGTNYVWQSLPNKLTQNRYINVREIVLYASNPYYNTSTIKVQLFNGATTVFSYQTTKTKQPIHADPTMIRIPCGGITLNNAIVRVTATGATGAPIIHSITLGCTIRQHVQTVGS